jgi:hypothetical protein
VEDAVVSVSKIHRFTLKAERKIRIPAESWTAVPFTTDDVESDHLASWLDPVRGFIVPPFTGEGIITMFSIWDRPGDLLGEGVVRIKHRMRRDDPDVRNVSGDTTFTTQFPVLPGEKIQSFAGPTWVGAVKSGQPYAFDVKVILSDDRLRPDGTRIPEDYQALLTTAEFKLRVDH